MSKRQTDRLVRVGDYIAEVSVELIEEPGGWSPYLSLEDANRLDDVRDALGRGDFDAARTFGRVFKLTPIEHHS